MNFLIDTAKTKLTDSNYQVQDGQGNQSIDFSQQCIYEGVGLGEARNARITLSGCDRKVFTNVSG